MKKRKKNQESRIAYAVNPFAPVFAARMNPVPTRGKVSGRKSKLFSVRGYDGTYSVAERVTSASEIDEKAQNLEEAFDIAYAWMREHPPVINQNHPPYVLIVDAHSYDVERWERSAEGWEPQFNTGKAVTRSDNPAPTREIPPTRVFNNPHSPYPKGSAAGRKRMLAKLATTESLSTKDFKDAGLPFELFLRYAQIPEEKELEVRRGLKEYIERQLVKNPTDRLEAMRNPGGTRRREGRP